MARERREELSHSEWLDTGWDKAVEAVETLIRIAKKENLKRLKVDRPFGIEIELAE